MTEDAPGPATRGRRRRRRAFLGGFLLPESVIGKIYTYRGPILSTGGVVQMFALPNRALRIHGGSKSVFAQQEVPANIAQALLHYRHCRFDELRETVEPDTDLPLPPDTPGEIVVDMKVPNIVMRAYYGMPEKTAEFRVAKKLSV